MGTLKAITMCAQSSATLSMQRCIAAVAVIITAQAAMYIGTMITEDAMCMTGLTVMGQYVRRSTLTATVNRSV